MKHRPSPAVSNRIVGTFLVASLAGCGDADSRLSELATQVTHEQAEQNLRVSEGSKAVAQGSRDLVEADAKARRELIDFQQSLRQDQAVIGQQRDALEVERKAIADQRRSESSITTGAVILGLLFACLAPLILAGISLLGLWRDTTREEEGEVLVEELANNLTSGPAPSSQSVLRASDPPRGLPPAQAPF
jgi:hypothetical protein